MLRASTPPPYPAFEPYHASSLAAPPKLPSISELFVAVSSSKLGDSKDSSYHMSSYLSSPHHLPSDCYPDPNLLMSANSATPPKAMSPSNSPLPPPPSGYYLPTSDPNGEYLLPEIPAEYFPSMTAPCASSSIQNSSPRSASSFLHPALMGGIPPKRQTRDHREGDLATAMILMGIQAKSDPAFPFRKKRQRSSPAQLNILEEEFLCNPMPSHMARVELALRLNMTPRRIQVWFQNKRAKVRRAIRNGEDVQVSLPESDHEEPETEI